MKVLALIDTRDTRNSKRSLNWLGNLLRDDKTRQVTAGEWVTGDGKVAGALLSASLGELDRFMEDNAP